MSATVRHTLHLLQVLCLARIELACCRLASTGSLGDDLRELDIDQRLLRCERQVARWQASLTPRQESELRIGRAMHLHLMLSSAPARLKGWSDLDALDAMPRSRLFEWIAHDYERLELTQLESEMSPEEAARYVSASSGGPWPETGAD